MKGWSSAPLSDLLQRRSEWITLDPDTDYKQATIRMWGKGVTLRGVVKGAAIAASSQLRIRQGDFIISRIDARHGAFGLVPPDMDGAVVSQDFPAFDVREDRVLPGFLNWMSKTQFFINICRSASEGTTNRVRLKEDRFFSKTVPLPAITQQQRIVAQLDAAAERSEWHRVACEEMQREVDATLLVAFREIVKNAPLARMDDIAPLVRRVTEIDPDCTYPELGIRSFGKGTFHKPAIKGMDLGSKRLFKIASGDLLFNIVFAWEGAIAIASDDDHGRFGSHRFLTCVADTSRTTSTFLRFYFLTDEGMRRIGEASPGGAGRNRTLGLKGLEAIQVPVPSLDAQLWFDELQAKASYIRAEQAKSLEEMESLIPSLLDRVFNGKMGGVSGKIALSAV
jgi:type I restriction enzyme, S subunit